MAAEVLVTWTGPIGWAVAITSWLFGRGSKAKARDKLFRGHKERNAARGWKPGDNQTIFQAATGGAYEARVSAAQRAIDSVNALLGEIPAAPWLRRAKFGKGGKLYTLRDVQANIVRSNRAINEAQIKAQKAESARQAKVRRTQGGSVLSDDRWRGGRGGSRGPFGSYTRGTAANTIQSALFGAAIDKWLGGKLDSDSARERLSRSTNRRGALAQQPVRSFGTPGRTAAGDAGRLHPAPAQSGASKSAGNVASQSGNASSNKVVSRGATGESQASRTARSVLEGSKSLPATVVGTKASTGLAQLLGVGAASALFNTAGRFPNTTSVVGTSSRTPLAMGSRLTPLNATGVQSGFQQPCRCPQPEKKKRKSDKQRCKNPVISRTTKDGIRTTKVRLECQPSKPK